MDRRAGFFLIAAVACFVLTPVADPGHRMIAVITGVVYVVLALLSALDRASRNRMQPRSTSLVAPVPSHAADAADTTDQPR